MCFLSHVLISCSFINTLNGMLLVFLFFIFLPNLQQRNVGRLCALLHSFPTLPWRYPGYATLEQVVLDGSEIIWPHKRHLLLQYIYRNNRYTLLNFEVLFSLGRGKKTRQKSMQERKLFAKMLCGEKYIAV